MYKIYISIMPITKFIIKKLINITFLFCKYNFHAIIISITIIMLLNIIKNLFLQNFKTLVLFYIV